jgi:hypothetical protein
MQNTNLSNKDPGQISRHEHDEYLNAKRVVIVGDAKIELDTAGIKQQLEESFKTINFTGGNGQVQVVEIPKIITERVIDVVQIEKEKIVVIPEIRIERIEVPVFNEKIVKIEVERPVYYETLKIIEVEKPVIIKETIEVTPKWVMPVFFTNLVLLTGAIITIALLLKK